MNQESEISVPHVNNENEEKRGMSGANCQSDSLALSGSRKLKNNAMFMMQYQSEKCWQIKDTAYSHKKQKYVYSYNRNS